MMDAYRVVKWTPSKNHWISDQAAGELRRRIAEADAHNANVLRQKREAYNRMLSIALDVFGSGSAEVKYLRRAGIPTPPSHKSVLHKLDKELRERDRWHRQRAKAADYRLRQNEAVERLESAGFERGTDFTRSNAITFAKRNLEYVDGRYVRRTEAMLTAGTNGHTP